MALSDLMRRAQARVDRGVAGDATYRRLGIAAPADAASSGVDVGGASLSPAELHARENYLAAKAIQRAASNPNAIGARTLARLQAANINHPSQIGPDQLRLADQIIAQTRPRIRYHGGIYGDA